MDQEAIAVIGQLTVASVLGGAFFLLRRYFKAVAEENRRVKAEETRRQRRGIEDNKRAKRHETLKSKMPDKIEIADPQYFFRALSTGHDEWAILIKERETNKFRVYFCGGREQGTIEDYGVVFIYDTMIFPNKDKAISELHLNQFYERNIKEMHASYLDGCGPMWEPPIEPNEYRLRPEGFFYSEGPAWKRLEITGVAD